MKTRWASRPAALALLFAALAGVRAAVYAFVLIPPWQAPDEPGHFAYVRELAQAGLQPPTPAQRAAIQDQIIRSLDEQRFWRLLWYAPARLPHHAYLALAQTGASTPPRPATLRAFAETRYLKSQRDEPPAYYLPAAGLLRLTSDIIGQLYLARAWSVILYAGALACIVLGLCELAPASGFVALVGAALAALAPMPAFIGSSCNNDAGAMLLGAATLWLLLRGLRHGWPARRLLALAALLILATYTKKTTLFLWPLAAVAVAWPSAGRWRAWLRRPIALAATLGLAAAVVVAALWPTAAASAWADAAGRLAQRSSDAVHSGRYALAVPPAGELPAQIAQQASFNQFASLRGQNVELTLWVAGGTAGVATIYDDERATRVAFRAPAGGWTAVRVQHRLAEGARLLGVALVNTGPARLLADDISLRAAGGSELLHNGGAEQAARWGETWLAAGGPAGLWPRLLEPASYSPASLARYALYLALAFAGFWANFGWLTLPLAPAWYVGLALLCGAALAGLTLGLARVGLCPTKRPKWGAAPPHALWALCALAVALAAAQTFLPMLGSGWQPQGRYLFPALLPICALLARGWRELAPAAGRRLWGAALVAGMVIFEQVCIWAYLLPHYRG
jgi:hypothetical protein